MNCYNHPDIPALGICKNCSKGLCKDCLTELENGIACTSTCVDEVKIINALIDRNKGPNSIISKSLNRSTFILGASGLVFLIYGLNIEGISGFSAILGIIFCIGAMMSYFASKNIKLKN